MGLLLVWASFAFAEDYSSARFFRVSPGVYCCLPLALQSSEESFATDDPWANLTNTSCEREMHCAEFLDATPSHRINRAPAIIDRPQIFTGEN
jgi:hypothetical protein